MAPANWLTQPLWADGERGGQVGSLVPDGFPAYARLLHPARSALADGPATLRWADIATARGGSVGPETRFNELAGYSPARDGADPRAVHFNSPS